MQRAHAGIMKDSVTIVLAEDDPDLRALYGECLRKNGYVVLEAEDGGEALRLVRSSSPDLLLLDIWMPVLNGLEVLEQIGRSPEAVGLKVVVLSHAIDSDSRLEGYALGAHDYWTKDITLHELCEGIEQLISPNALAPGDRGE
jgi:CheY-like chemotaxis protein